MATPLGANRAPFDARTAAEATGGRVARATAGRAAIGVTTDSRAVRAGNAFVALRGQHHDAHEFLASAIAAGAALVVVERGRAPGDDRVDAVEVDDTLTAWGALARHHVLRWRQASRGARVVGITGSAGKTTTKEICAALLRGAGDGLATTGNLNNRVGLPAMVFELEPRHRFAVLEMGMSVPGEIAALAGIACPDVGVVVNVGLAHAGGVGGSVEDVAREKGALFRGVRPGGTLVANVDDALVMRAAEGCERARVTFGRGAADVRLVERAALALGGSRVVLERAGRRSTFTLGIPGEAAALDLAAAVAAAEAAAGSLDDAEMARALEGLGPIAGRMQVRRAGDVHIVDDSYNANPASMRAALEALGEMHAGRRVAVLGEMKELGTNSEREHEALGDAVARAGVSLMVSCGGLADTTARAAERHGVEIVLARDADDAARLTSDLVRPGDLVLVKASRSVGADRVARALAERAG